MNEKVVVRVKPVVAVDSPSSDAPGAAPGHAEPPVKPPNRPGSSNGSRERSWRSSGAASRGVGGSSRRLDSKGQLSCTNP
eukprot:tig00001029_g6442.t1